MQSVGHGFQVFKFLKNLSKVTLFLMGVAGLSVIFFPFNFLHVSFQSYIDNFNFARKVEITQIAKEVKILVVLDDMPLWNISVIVIIIVVVVSSFLELPSHWLSSSPCC